MILQNHFSKWCVWRLGAPRPGSDKRSKPPYDPNTGGLARKDDPGTFGSFDDAQRAFSGRSYNGLGLLMASGAGMTCVDIDNCLSDDGTPNAIAAWALNNFKGYGEVSQSGHGLHFFMRASKPAGCKTRLTHESCSLEIYASTDSAYIAVTEKPLGESCGDVLDEQAALDRFIDRFGFMRTVATSVPKKAESNNRTADDADDDEHSDVEILELLRKRNKRGRITRLFAGDLKDYNDDHSAADLALASEIAFYTEDPEQLERIFSTSQLAGRDKWRDRADYRERTIAKALDSTPNLYWDKKASKAARVEAAAAHAQELIPGAFGKLQLSKTGSVASTLDNALQVLLSDHRTMGAAGFNLFSGAPEALRPLRDVFGSGGSTTVGEFSDHDTTVVRAWFNRAWRIVLSKNDTDDVLLLWARHAEFNPVTSKLDALAVQWDGTKRLDAWLQDYLGVDGAGIEEYLRSIGRGWIIGAVARAFQPGCKMDTVLVLEGIEGARKSSAMRVIAEAVYARGFVENLPSLSNSKETILALRGAHIVELAELSSIQGRVQSEAVKAFLTAQEDNGRELYGKRYSRWKRTVAFCGTTNSDEYLRDTTGRRFWSVKVGLIDIERLRRDAPQLWGEAVHAYRAGEAWHLKDTLVLKQASEQQHERQVTDVWDDAIADFARDFSTRAENLIDFAITKPIYRWSLNELFKLVFVEGHDLEKRNQEDQRRFAASLRRCGFADKKVHGCKRWGLTAEKARALRIENIVEH